MRKSKAVSGFTFVELAVVICILSVLLFFSMPMFERINWFSNKAPSIASLTSLIQSLKQKSISENKTYYLNIDTNTGQVWVAHDEMDLEQQAEALEKADLYDDETIILNLECSDFERPGAKSRNSGVHQIKFFKNGYSDQVLVHLKENDKDVTLKIGAFLMNVERFDRYVSFDDCT